MGLLCLKIVIVIAFVWLWLRWFERSNLYFPDRQLTANPGTFGMEFEDAEFSTSDGKRIHGWWIPAAGQGGQLAAPTILFCHGNAGNISHRMDKADRLHRMGVNILLFDYRGYGNSQGRPSEKGTYRDAEAAYRYLVDRLKISPEKIVFYGESLGAAVAVETAVHYPVGGVILESPFTSIIDMGRLVFPWLPVRWMVTYFYDNRAKIPQLKSPLLILHSPQDEIAPFHMAEQLYAAAPQPKQLVKLLGDHNAGYMDSGDIYTQAISRFLRGLPSIK